MEREIVELLGPESYDMASRLWEGDRAETPIDDVVNLVYDFESGGRKRILRLTHSSHRSEEEVRSELDFLMFVSENGVSVSPPVPSVNGRLTEIIPVEDSYFVAVVFERAPGGFVDPKNPDVWNEDLFRSWGRLVGRMHSLTKVYDPGGLKIRPGRELHGILARARKKDSIRPEVVGYVERTLCMLEALPKDHDSYGLVHNDLNPTNFHVDDGEITIFDFDDCAYNWFIADIAGAMPFQSSLFRGDDWEERTEEYLHGFLGGYAQENWLDPTWFGYLPDLFRMQNISSVIFSHEIDQKNRELYDDWFGLVLDIHAKGHPWFGVDFIDAYEAAVKCTWG